MTSLVFDTFWTGNRKMERFLLAIHLPKWNRTHFLLLSKVHSGSHSPMFHILCSHLMPLQSDALQNICMTLKQGSRKTRSSHCAYSVTKNELMLLFYRILMLWQIFIQETEHAFSQTGTVWNTDSKKTERNQEIWLHRCSKGWWIFKCKELSARQH